MLGNLPGHLSPTYMNAIQLYTIIHDTTLALASLIAALSHTFYISINTRESRVSSTSPHFTASQSIASTHCVSDICTHLASLRVYLFIINGQAKQ